MRAETQAVGQIKVFSVEKEPVVWWGLLILGANQIFTIRAPDRFVIIDID